MPRSFEAIQAAVHEVWNFLKVLVCLGYGCNVELIEIAFSQETYIITEKEQDSLIKNSINCSLLLIVNISMPLQIYNLHSRLLCFRRGRLYFCAKYSDIRLFKDYS